MSFQIPWAKPVFSPGDKEHCLDALNSTWISGGPYVEQLEREFTARIEGQHGIATSNGTTALHLAMLGLGIGPGDEVIVPGFTFVAPANMVIAVGATPVFADIDPETWCIDPKSVQACITGKTKAIIAVHVYGNVCDMRALGEIADNHELFLVEDTAEAAFSKHDGRYAGTFGTIGCFSFHATKTITTGEGGFVVTPRKDLYDKMKLICSHGMNPGKRYWHEWIGYNFRLTNLQAALGCSQLANLEQIIVSRRRMDALYRQELRGVEGISFQKFSAEVDPVVWAVAVRIDPERFGIGRDKVMELLGEAGIQTRPGFYPFHQMPLYNSRFLSVADDIGGNVVSFPSFPSIREEEIVFVTSTLKEIQKNNEI